MKLYTGLGEVERMNPHIKKILKLFIPPIIIKIKNYFSSSEKKLFFSTISEIQKQNKVLLILGNGPSLNTSIAKYKTKMLNYDILVVNHFCETEYYKELKPKYYLIADPNAFAKLDTLSDIVRDLTLKMQNALVANTSWIMNLILPSIAKNSDFVFALSKNSFIHIFYYNTQNMTSCKTVDEFEAFDKNLIAVPSQTVLNACLYYGIFKRYEYIYIMGADTNWIEKVHVNQETNQVYMYDEHYYGTDKRPLFIDVYGKVPSKLHEELYAFARALESYWVLKDYADYAGVTIYNASEYSLIDAFERNKLSGI